MNKKSRRGYFNELLFAAILAFIFTGFVAGDQRVGGILVSIFSTLMLLFATFTIQSRSKALIYAAFGVILLREATHYLIQNQYLDSIASVANVSFFLYVVFHLVRQVARSKEVNLDVIMESVNGYLLIGLSGGVLLGLVGRVQENAYAFPSEGMREMVDYIYFGFITLTTVGYGEITPVSGLARFLSISIGISGQLYIAIIIATLVGKYLSQQSNSE